MVAVVGLENLAGGMGTAAFVAYISGLCNARFTATQYALLSSFASYLIEKKLSKNPERFGNGAVYVAYRLRS